VLGIKKLAYTTELLLETHQLSSDKEINAMLKEAIIQSTLHSV
jgi:hypothetical protein